MTTTVMTGKARMVAACRLQAVDATPVWFMRQAGRCLADYRKLREKYEILTIAKTPDLSTQVTLMAVDRFGVDGAVLYADIMLVLDGMGLPFYIEPEIGPIIPQPVRTEADIDRLRVIPAEEATPYVFQAIRQIRRELGERAAVVGFAGGPFTLACYMIEGRPAREYAFAKSLMFSRPDLWHKLMGKITEVLVRYYRGQVEAGIHVAQLFDSWVGVLSPREYERFVLPYNRRIFAELRTLNIPSIHFGTGTASLLELMTKAGSDLVSVDWRVGLDEAWRRIGHDRGIQGNLDPTALLAPWETVAEETRDILRRAEGRRGHVFNLGHGVMPDTDPDYLARIVELVHEETSGKRA